MDQLLPKNKVFIDEEFKLDCNRDGISMTLAEDGCINFRHYTNVRRCSICGDCNIIHTSSSSSMWKACVGLKHFYCLICHEGYAVYNNDTCKDEAPIKDISITHNSLYVYLYGYVKFECKWPSCNKLFSVLNLKTHELKCVMHPRMTCPVINCHVGRHGIEFNKMTHHFLSQHSSLHIVFQNVVDNLKPGKYYLFLLEKFVLVEYEVEELGEVYKHKINLKVCNEKSISTQDLFKPVGVISKNGKLVKKIMQNDYAMSVHKNVKLFVYFDDE